MKVDVVLSSDNDSSQNTSGLILMAAHKGLLEVVMVQVAMNIASMSLLTARESQTYARTFVTKNKYHNSTQSDWD